MLTEPTRELHFESLRGLWETGTKPWPAQSFEAIAVLQLSDGALERAACLWGAAESLREVMSAPLAPSERSRHDESIRAARARLEEERFGAAWAKGKAM